MLLLIFPLNQFLFCLTLMTIQCKNQRLVNTSQSIFLFYVNFDCGSIHMTPVLLSPFQSFDVDKKTSTIDFIFIMPKVNCFQHLTRVIRINMRKLMKELRDINSSLQICPPFYLMEDELHYRRMNSRDTNKNVPTIYPLSI